MKKVDKGLTLQIQGKDYQISCQAEEQENLQLAAAYLSQKLDDINNRGKVIGTERSAMLAALNISYELIQVQEQQILQAEFQKRITKLHSTIESTVDQFRQISL